MDTSSRALLGLKIKEKPKTFMSFALVFEKLRVYAPLQSARQDESLAARREIRGAEAKALTDDQVKSELALNYDSAVVTYLGAL